MKTTNKTDWHQAIIVARLRMSGTSLRQLSKDNDLYPTALSVALLRPWLKAERIIAAAIGVAPSQIWPSRYAHRESKQQRRIKQFVDTAASIGQCSHDCNINITGKV
jgi:Ner family transcriptional regulator